MVEQRHFYSKMSSQAGFKCLMSLKHHILVCSDVCTVEQRSSVQCTWCQLKDKENINYSGVLNRFNSENLASLQK